MKYFMNKDLFGITIGNDLQFSLKVFIGVATKSWIRAPHVFGD